MSFETSPIPHVDFEPGSFFFGELVLNALLYAVAVVVLLAVMYGVGAGLKALGGGFSEGFRNATNRD